MSEFTEELEFKPVQQVPERKPMYTGYYRQGTEATPIEVNFLICAGGIGDYICWMSAIKWVLDTQLQVVVNLYVQDFFMEIASRLFTIQKYPNRIRVRNIMELLYADLTKMGPVIQPKPDAFPNAMGMHLVDLGFSIFTNTTPEGEYREHVRLDVDDILVPHELPEKYAIITTGHTTQAREWRPKGINGVAAYLKEKGITPVFLGKREIFKPNTPNSKDKNTVYTANFNQEVDYSVGIDLREKTSLLQAAKIMSKAQVVVGLDNGLLHLAGTQDVPIVFGLNIARPVEREIRRPAGSKPVHYLTPDPKELACTFCQSKQRFNNGQDFKFCLYKDYVCLDVLADPKPWIKAIELVL